MTLTPEQKEHAVDLIAMGDKLEAVRYLQEALHVTADQALVLAEKLEEEVASPIMTEQEEKAFHDQVTKATSFNVGKLVGSIFMGVGSVMLIVVAYLVYSNMQFAKRAKPVKGKVMAYDSYESKDSDNNGYTTMYTPTFEYAYNGKTYTYKSTTSSSGKEFEIGEMVDVLVDPNEPEKVIVHSFMEEWFVSVLLGFMGTMFTGMGYMAYRVFGNRTPVEPPVARNL